MPKIVDMLVEKLDEVNSRDRHLVESALHVTMGFDTDYTGRLAITHHLIEHYPELDVNVVNIIKETPLHTAVSARNVEGVKYLLEKCPQLNVNATNIEGWTPLRNAESIFQHVPFFELSREDKIKHQEELKQIIELLKAHGGRVDKEEESRIHEARKKIWEAREAAEK